ncbi:peptidase G1, partial [Ganoderma leucocontextum]
YSANWAGAIVSEKTATYKEVTGTFVVPTPKEPSGASGAHRAAVWVGIDGTTCNSRIFQAGVDLNVDGSSVSYNAWYEWFPGPAGDFSGITFKPGDTVTITLAATSKTSGTAWIKNHRTGKRVSHKFSGQPSLCQYDAEWIVEDFSVNGSFTPFANFGNVTFTDATACTLAGKIVGPANAQQMDLIQNNKVITKVTTGAKSVSIVYTGQ